jgi:hypothetical protein
LTTPSNDDSKTERNRNEQILKQLIHFLDQVLVEEWSADHASFTHIGSADEDPQEWYCCDFCGADIFQSFFACNKCSGVESSVRYVCCPLCLVEGRSCRCGTAHMNPCQTWPFDRLIRERNNAVDAITTQGSAGISQLSYDSLDGSHHLQIFKAACILYRQKQTRVNTVEVLSILIALLLYDILKPEYDL